MIEYLNSIIAITARIIAIIGFLLVGVVAMGGIVIILKGIWSMIKDE